MNEQKRLTRGLLLCMSAGAGVCVASLYYIQPLLAAIRSTFQISSPMAAILVTFTQIGYAIGLFLVLPAADILNRKRLILSVMIIHVAVLFVMAACGTYLLAIFLCVAVGFTAVTPQLLVPLTATLSSPEERGKNVGVVSGGLMLGILFARSASGLIGGRFGWHTIYVIAPIVVFVFVLIFIKIIPHMQPAQTISYRETMRSLLALPGKYTRLRASMLSGFLAFSVFCSFWTVLTFHLNGQPFGYRTEIIGLFGLFGAFGALMAPVAGRIADKKGVNFSLSVHCAIAIAATIILAVAGWTVGGVIAGAIVLDYGIQSCNVTNQARIQALSDTERNRITSIYMVCFFFGGAFGSAVGSKVYDHFGWGGFVAFALALLVIMIITHLIGAAREKQSK